MRYDNIKKIKKEGKMPKKISWILRIAFTAILLFIILFGVAESISESGFIETMKRPSVVVLFLIFALVSYVTSWKGKSKADFKRKGICFFLTLNFPIYANLTHLSLMQL